MRRFLLAGLCALLASGPFRAAAHRHDGAAAHADCGLCRAASQAPLCAGAPTPRAPETARWTGLPLFPDAAPHGRAASRTLTRGPPAA